MAGLIVHSAHIETTALVASTQRTLQQIVTAANKPVRLRKISVTFDGMQATDTFIMVGLYEQTTVGVTVADNTQKMKLEGTTDTPQTVFNVFSVVTTEPTTAGNPYRMLAKKTHPMGGQVTWVWPEGKGPVLPGGKKFGLVCLPSATLAGTVLPTSEIEIEE